MKMQKTFFVVLLIALLSTFMMAQAGAAKITGKVVTADGTAIPGVMVTATSSKMIGKAVAITDENGVYRLLNLKPANYKVTYELEGFATMVTPKVQLKIEQTLRIPIIMELKKLKETIIVEGQVPLIDVKSAAQGMTLNKETFDALPKGRDFSSLVTAIPGVTDEPMLSGISVDGASGAENVFYIDGVDVTNITNGAQGQNAAFDFIEEVQIKSSGYMAEFGGSLGGVISAVTRSGGNEFHGDIVAYYSGTALNGTPREILSLDKLDTSKATYYTSEQLYGDIQSSRIEAGINIGGYLLKDKVWFFGSFLPKYTKYTNDVTYADGSGSRSLETKTKSMNYMFKLTAQVMSNVRWSISYLNNFYNRRGQKPYTTDWGPYGNIDQSFDTTGYDWPNYSASTALDITIGNNSMLNIRAGLFFKDRTDPFQAPIPTTPLWRFKESALGGYSPTNNLMFPEIPANLQHTTAWQNYGFYDANALMSDIKEKKSISGDYTLYFNAGGEHSVKIGGQFVRQGENVNNGWQQPIFYIGWDRDAIAYGTNYGRGKYGYYVARGVESTGPNGSVWEAYSSRIALYVQDSWTIGEKLTLNFGIRTESEYIPSYSQDPDYADLVPVDFSFGDKIAPRLGFVYDVKGDSSLKVFGSFGLFYDVMKLNMAAGSYGGVKWKDAAYTLDSYDYTLLTADNTPGDLLYVKDFRIPSFDTTDPNIKPMSQQSISIGFENKLNEDLSLSVRLVQKHLRYAIEDVGNLTPDGEEYYTANPGFGWTLTEQNGGKFDNSYPDTPKAKREYYALNVGLDKRFSNNWMGGLSYTWSRLTGNYAGLATSDEVYSDGSARNSPNTARYFDLWYLAYDKSMSAIDGPLATDRTHVFKAYGSYIFPFGMTVGTVVNVMSGTPISEIWTLGAEILPYNRGNLGRTNMFYNADIYGEYNLKLGKANLQFSINITNVFNFKIARNIDPLKHLGSLAITEAQIISTNWEYPADAIPNPLYKMDFNYSPPISARLGLKLSF